MDNNKTDLVANSALELAGTYKWSDITLYQIAKNAKIDMSEMLDIASDKTDILRSIFKMFDRQAFENFDEIDDLECARDKLFDAIMAHFDVLQGNKNTLLSIFCETREATILPFILKESVGAILEICDLKAKGIKGHLMSIGVFGIYMRTLCAWRDDTQNDMASTMATLDNSLNKMQFASDFLKR